MSGQALRLYLFGSPRLVLDGVVVNLGRRKSLALLAYLAVTGQPHDRAALTTLFWPESGRRSARAALRQCLSDLKNKLEPPLLHLDAQMVSLDADAPLWVDVAAFGQYLAAGQQSPDWAHLKEAIDLYQADFMAGFVLPNAPDFDEWQRWQANCLKQEVLLACTELVGWLSAQEQLAEAIVYARRWANLDPLNEAVQAELLRLYLRDGQVSVATHHYDWFAEQMEGALGQRLSWDLAQLS